MEIRLRAESGNIHEAMYSVNKELAVAGCPETDMQLIDVVIDEVMENISSYAYEDGGEMVIGARCTQGSVELTFTDWGVAYNPLENADPDFTAEPRIGGLGIFLYKNIMDTAEYKRKDEANVLILTKNWS